MSIPGHHEDSFYLECERDSIQLGLHWGPWLPEERRPEWAKTRSREAREMAVQERGKRWLGPE